MNQTRHVKLGPKLFSKEKSMYRDFISALFRENIQNSVDAGASRIDICIETDGHLQKLTVSDDGPGMDMETLENVYFVLGETTKTSATSIGGFGVARMLTCFAQEKYTLRTRNTEIVGCGAEWTPTTVDEYHTGVSVSAWVDAGPRDMLLALKQYLSTCYIRPAVYVNGEKWKDWTYNNKFERDLSFGKVYTNKSKKTGVFVRSNGVTMFCPYVSAPFQVVIELDPQRSRSVLQAHRDGLVYQYQEELESFVAELNINKQSALREKKSKSIHYEGTGTFTSSRSKSATVEQQVEAFESFLLANERVLPDEARELLMSSDAEEIERRLVIVKRQLIAGGMKLVETPIEVGPLHNSGYDNDEETRQLNFDLFNVMVEDDTSNQRIRKVIESFYPQNWDLLGVVGERFDRRYGEYRSFRAGVERYKLLVMWKAACEFTIRLLQDELQIGGESISWGVGWIFSDQAHAAMKRDGGVNWLLLNPVKPNGNLRLGLSDKKALGKMVAHACHECAHLVYSDHDERFANLLDDLHEQAFIFKSEILSYMKGEKDAAMDRLERLAKAEKVA